MDNSQFAALLSAVTVGLGAIAGVIRWSVSTLAKALDRNTDAHLESVKSMTVMATKLDFVLQVTGKVDDFIKEETSKVERAIDADIDNTPVENPRRKKVAAVGGYSHHYNRPKTKSGDEE